MEELNNYKIHMLIIGEYETGFRIIVGKQYKKAGRVSLITFDKEEHQKTGDKVFHIWVTNEVLETRCHETFINQKYAVKYDSDY
jgi:hypothetical protein